VLVSAGNDWSENIIEGKEVSDWIGRGSCFCRDQDMKIQNHFKLRDNLKTDNAENTVLGAQHVRFMQVNITWYRSIFSSQEVLWKMKYDFVIAWTSVITKSYYIPVAILWSEIVTIRLRQRNNQYWATVITVSYIHTQPLPDTLIITFHQYPKQYYSIQTSHIFNNDDVLLPFIKTYRNRL
jgi:hypothetical protein